MSGDYEIFKKLLTIDELFELYSQIGDTILTHIDIENINKDKTSKNNSIQLLLGTFLIVYDTESKIYDKKMTLNKKESFIAELFKMLLMNYAEAFSFIDKAEIRYDEIEAKYCTKRNFIELSLSGLLMLLNGMGIVQFKNNYIYFIEKKLLSINSHEIRNTHRKTNLMELKNQLAIQEQLGNDAEIAAIEFEKNILFQSHISKIPERISLYDVTAGYDIASYLTIDSDIPDKFIEVKSCADESMQFYISRNELETAKNKRGNYYLYLLNRRTNVFTVIPDPYTVFFETGEGNWAIEPQVYQIHSIVR